MGSLGRLEQFLRTAQQRQSKIVEVSSRFCHECECIIRLAVTARIFTVPNVEVCLLNSVNRTPQRRACSKT